MQNKGPKKAAKAAKGSLEEGQPKRPRGRPRKAPHNQTAPEANAASKRKAITAVSDLESDPMAGAAARRQKPTAMKTATSQVRLQQEWQVHIDRAAKAVCYITVPWPMHHSCQRAACLLKHLPLLDRNANMYVYH